MSSLTQDVLKLCKGKPLDDVEKAMRALIDEVKHLRSVRDRTKAMAFRPGGKCIVNKGSRKLPEGTIGKVERVNSRTISVDFGILGPWKVATPFLDPYDGPEEVKRSKPVESRAK